MIKEIAIYSILAFVALYGLDLCTVISLHTETIAIASIPLGFITYLRDVTK